MYMKILYTQVHMMSMNTSYRCMILECLRENAANMRIEHQALCDRIRIALQTSRESLRRIENMNHQLQEIKVTVHNALASISQPEPADVKYVVRDIYNVLADNVAALLSNSVFESVTHCLHTVPDSKTIESYDGAIITLDNDPVPERVPDSDSDPQSTAESSAEFQD
ncbi:uncharacterized protein LOC117895086 [Drosophila subobscura]|uniref:uncharacterized protein LOC117895086 n=1 Tax=Drosophila subobscura TaxID=7241 RepID=UPI00155AD88C|nr:uncharacterized protein LOC117895086 [Drosophila subobscura]